MVRIQPGVLDVEDDVQFAGKLLEEERLESGGLRRVFGPRGLGGPPKDVEVWAFP